MSAKKAGQKQQQHQQQPQHHHHHQQEEQVNKWYVLIPRPIRSAYRRVVPRFLRVFLRTRTRWFWGLLALFVVGQHFFNRIGFGIPFFILALITAVAVNLNYSGEKREGLSAYSVFNPRQERLIGTYDPQEYERMLRGGGGGGP